MFDVIVTLNLYGDIISDIAAQIAGSVGLAGSANIGEHLAMFEAIHGSAPDISGKGIANPSGLLMAAVMMLVHIHQVEAAAKVHNAWLRTIEEGYHTADVFEQGISRQRVSTEDFANIVINHLGEIPRELREVHYFIPKDLNLKRSPRRKDDKELVGVDVFLDWSKGKPNELGDELKKVFTDKLMLKVITNRGIKVYPDGLPETFCTDHWRCRFWSGAWNKIDNKDIIELLQKVEAAGFEFIKTENLYTFNGRLGFSEVHG